MEFDNQEYHLFEYRDFLKFLVKEFALIDISIAAAGVAGNQ